MKTIETKVYQLDELSPEAKEKARNWYREGLDYEWWDGIYEDATTIGKLIGLDITNIYFSGFSSQGDGACFEGSFEAGKVQVGKVKQYAPKDTRLHQIGAEFERISKAFPNSSFNVKHAGYYQHSSSTVFNVSILDENGEEIDTEKAAKAQTDLIGVGRSFMNWIYRQLEKEYDYLNSDEAVDESIKSNEYTFTESGRRFG